MKSATFVFFIVSLSVLAVVHALSLKFFLYWTYLWLDIPMHILGGAVVALGFLTFMSTYARMSIRRGLPATLAVVLIVGAGWEIFEYLNGLIDMEKSPLGDTLFDFAMDLVGGVAGYVLARTSHTVDS